MTGAATAVNTVEVTIYTGASVSTHVLDAAAGGPLRGVRVDLYDSGGEHLASEVTDEHGRVDELASALDPGRYRISWHVGGHFVSEISATVRLQAGHHHVPVLATGGSAMVYLGA